MTKTNSFASMPFIDPWSPHLIHWIFAMEERGWLAQPMIWWPVSLFKHRRRIPIIVFHWPNTYWRMPSERKARSRALIFRLMVRLAKFLGYKLVWIVNNVLPHDAKHKDLEIAQRKWIVKHFDLVVGFAKNARTDLEEVVGPLKTRYVGGVLGHYEGLYPATADRQELVSRFGVNAEKFSLLLVISDKPYKGHATFLEAWAKADTHGLQLVLAGPTPKSMLGMVKSLPGDVLHIGADQRVPHYALGDLHRACDMVALPYLRITTSAAYLLAITLDRPVLAPDLPFFKLHTGQEKPVALLYEHSRGVDSIGETLSALGRNGFTSHHSAYQELKDQYNWRNFAGILAPAFDDLVKNRA